MLCAFGPSEHECLHKAAVLGGNCRVGFENSRVNANANTWPDNAASVKALNELL
ncbi:MAG: 3-keto-5-aminohexanoate cleavage protein [Nitratireductor sp.]